MNEQKGNVVLENFNFTFPGKEEPFLKNISMFINKGEFTVIVGPSSCGKSTLGLCLVGLYPNILGGEVQGKIEIGGLSLKGAETEEIATKAGIVFQDPDSQFCNLFVEEEIAFGAENLLIKKEEIIERVNKYLKFVNLEGFNLRRTSELSGGQKQRIAIASVLSMEPEILILDQPTANLDPTGKREIFETLFKLNQETGITLILIEHQIDELIKYVDKLIIMQKGQIIMQGEPRKLLEKECHCLEQCGLWVPEVSRVGYAMQKSGLKIKKFPISPEELVESIKENLLPLKKTFSEKRIIDSLSNEENNENIIEVENLVFSYPRKPNTINDISFNIKKGSITAIMGENGSGKSTLSMLLIGLLKPDSGKILLNNMDISKEKVSKICSQIGYVFQYPEHQFITTKVRDEIAYGLKNANISQEETNNLIDATLRIVELDGLDERHPLTLGMGEKRRLSIATMIVKEPKVLILDEPSAGLDYKNCEHMMTIIKNMHDEGVAIIMITHTTYLVAKYVEDILLMNKGKLVFCGKTKDLFRKLDLINTNAIEKPEILKTCELLKGTGYNNIPNILVADEIVNILREAQPYE